MILCSVSDSVLNAINLTIYVKWRRVYSPRQTILKLLTIVDLFISIVIIPCSIVVQLFDSLPDEVRLFLSFIKLSVLFMSSLLFSIVAAQRCASLHFPTRIQTNANTYVSVCVISLFSFIVVPGVCSEEIRVIRSRVCLADSFPWRGDFDHVLISQHIQHTQKAFK